MPMYTKENGPQAVKSFLYSQIMIYKPDIEGAPALAAASRAHRTIKSRVGINIDTNATPDATATQMQARHALQMQGLQIHYYRDNELEFIKLRVNI